MNISITKYLTPKIVWGFSILILLILIYFLAPWISSHVHLTSLQSQLNDLNKSILSNSQRRQELDQKISALRKEQSELSKLNLDIRKQRDQLELQIAEQMGLGTGGQASPITTQSWSQVEK